MAQTGSSTTCEAKDDHKLYYQMLEQVQTALPPDKVTDQVKMKLDIKILEPIALTYIRTPSGNKKMALQKRNSLINWLLGSGRPRLVFRM